MNREEEFQQWSIEKQKQSRKDRSTSCFYDDAFWRAWEWRFNMKPDEENKTVKREAEKKLGFIKKYKIDPSSLLDVGCGMGFFVSLLRRNNIKAWGCDISKEAIEKSSPNVRPFLKIMNVRNMSDWKDNEFDMITAFDLLEHLYIEEFMDAIREINRIASKVILIRSPVHSWDSEPWLSDLSIETNTREHVSIYPWNFWVKRFVEIGKFDFWLCEIWNSYDLSKQAEGWILLRRKKDGA